MSLISIKTLCTNCQGSLECQWPERMNWGGEDVSAIEYMANALNSDDTLILCDDCVDNFPDVDTENMEVEYI
jgi:hypothetical protein